MGKRITCTSDSGNATNGGRFPYSIVLRDRGAVIRAIRRGADHGWADAGDAQKGGRAGVEVEVCGEVLVTVTKTQDETTERRKEKGGGNDRRSVRGDVLRR